MKALITAAVLAFAAPAFAASHAGGAPMKDPKAACEAMSAEKKLAGAAKDSFEKKCIADHSAAPNAACEKSAADKNLSGAAKTSHIKKCTEDAMAASKK
jgi:hypothetical protein